MLLLLLSFSTITRPKPDEEVITVAELESAEVSEEPADQGTPEPARQAEQQQLPPAAQPPAARAAEPLPPQPAPSSPLPTPPLTLPTPYSLPSSNPSPRPSRPAPSGGQVFGPPDSGGSASSRDSEVVGRAPNGQPLYAAAWHREPRPDQLRDYLSTARGPGWGLIACRTAPNYRVEDCVALDEYPEGSQINRAILAAAWEFQVRPPRRGGELLVGSWVRIRIDYRSARR